jgi:hypothetical protein
MTVSESSPAPADESDSRGRKTAAQLLDLRAGVRNVTCAGETQIRLEAHLTPSGPQFLFVSRAQVTFRTPGSRSSHDPRPRDMERRFGAALGEPGHALLPPRDRCEP